MWSGDIVDLVSLWSFASVPLSCSPLCCMCRKHGHCQAQQWVTEWCDVMQRHHNVRHQEACLQKNIGSYVRLKMLKLTTVCNSWIHVTKSLSIEEINTDTGNMSCASNLPCYKRYGTILFSVSYQCWLLCCWLYDWRQFYLIWFPIVLWHCWLGHRNVFVLYPVRTVDAGSCLCAHIYVCNVIYNVVTLWITSASDS